MPQICHHKLPRALIAHLAERVLQRGIQVDQTGLFGGW